MYPITKIISHCGIDLELLLVMKNYFEYDVIVETAQLGILDLNPKRKQRLELIYDLHLKGWSNKQISDHLNFQNLKTLRKKIQYSPKLIWMTIHKYKNRLSRKSDKILRIKESIKVSLSKDEIKKLLLKKLNKDVRQSLKKN